MGREPYHETKRVLADITSGFVGWKKIEDIAKSCLENNYYSKPSKMFSDEQRNEMRKALRLRDQGLVATEMLTGGRATEVLMLKKKNFVIEEDFIYARKVPLLKRHILSSELMQKKKTMPTNNEMIKAKKNREEWRWDSKEFSFKKYKVLSEPVIIYREEFPIPRWEPLTEYFINLLENSRGFLFPSPYFCTRKEPVGVEKWIKEVFGKEGRPWISPQRTYQIVKEASERVGDFVVVKGVKARGVWNHWFRSQRASQLARDYEFGDNHLNAFFGWVEPRDSGTSKRYTKIGVIGLEDQMLENKERHIRMLKRDYRRD